MEEPNRHVRTRTFSTLIGCSFPPGSNRSLGPSHPPPPPPLRARLLFFIFIIICTWRINLRERRELDLKRTILRWRDEMRALAEKVKTTKGNPLVTVGIDFEWIRVCRCVCVCRYVQWTVCVRVFHPIYHRLNFKSQKDDSTRQSV